MTPSSWSIWCHAPATRSLLAGAVALRRAVGDDRLQIGLLVHPRRRREGRQVGRDQAKVEGQRGGELPGLVDDPGPAREASALLGVAAQVRERARVEPPLHLLQAPARAQRREHVGAREGVGRGVVHVVRRHERDVVTYGQLGQDVVARDVVGRAVVPESRPRRGRDRRWPRDARVHAGRRAVPRSIRARVRAPLRQPAQDEPLALRVRATSSRLKRGAPFSPRRR